MATSDLDVVLEVQRCAGLSWSRAQLGAQLDEPSSLWLVAEDVGAVIGYAGALRLVDELHVANIAVRPASQRRGTASVLMRALLREGHRQGAAAATLEVRSSNRAARELYRRLGFAPVSVRRRYYADTGEDAIVMWLHDLDAVEEPRASLHERGV